MPEKEKILLHNQPVAKVIIALQKHKVLTYSELVKVGVSGALLKSLSEKGLIIAIGSGIYGAAELDPFVASILATAKYYPQCVISGLTALQIHGLAEEFIERVDVDIPRETSIRNRMLNVHRVPAKRIIGFSSVPFHGGKIKIYDIERTLCEAYRLDPKGPLFFKALKRYRGIGNVDPDRIAQYDRVLKTEVLMHLRQELADG